jgi:hypothetical protein
MDAKVTKCQKCGEIVPSKRALRRHLRSRHPLQASEADDDDDSCCAVVANVQNALNIVGARAVGVDCSTVSMLHENPPNSEVPEVSILDAKSSNGSKNVHSREVVDGNLDVALKWKVDVWLHFVGIARS